jgi:hypothetical protein
MVDAAVIAMAYLGLELTTYPGPFTGQGRPYSVGEVSSGCVTSSDTAGGFAVKLSKVRRTRDRDLSSAGRKIFRLEPYVPRLNVIESDSAPSPGGHWTPSLSMKVPWVISY